MSERKQTPDILAEILGGSTGLPEVEGLPDPAVRPVTRRARPSTAQAKPAAERKRPAPAVEKHEARLWEHRITSFQEHRGWRLRFVDGVEVADWSRGPTICEYIAQASQDGWQVAGACTGQPMFGLLDKYQIYLKRSR